MSPEKATMANPSVVKLVPNRTDYKQWKESTLNLLAIQGLAHYTKTPGFGANLNMQTASKEKVHCANNMSKCYQIIWNTLDRSIQAKANFQQLNHEDQEKVPMKLLLLCEAFKNSKSESSLLWAKLSQPPNNIKQLVNWVDDFQYNFARYKDMNANSLEVDHILHLWSRSTQPRIRDMARVIQDEKSKEPHNIDRIVLMIKNQADRLGQWNHHESTESDQDKSSRKRKNKSDDKGKDSTNNGNAKKQRTNNVYCHYCFEKFKVKRYGHTKDECSNNPANASPAGKPKPTKKITADTGSAATLLPANATQQSITRDDLKGLSKKAVLDLLEHLQLDDLLSTDEEGNKMDTQCFSYLSHSVPSYAPTFLPFIQTPLHCLMTKKAPHTQTFIGFDGSIQTGLRGAEPINLAEGLSINDTYELKNITDPIVSVSQVNDQGHFTIFTKNELFVIPEDIITNKLLELLKTKSILGGYREDGVYYFNEQKSIQTSESVNLLKCYNVIARDINKDNLTIWHQRLGHIGWNRLIQTLRVNNMLPKNLNYNNICDICFKSKMVDRPFGTNIKPTMPNEVISMDLIDFGKQYISIRDYRYVLVIVDHYTSYTWTYLLENRKDLMKPINEWYQFIKTQNKDYPVKTILADGEFITNKLVSFCSANGIKHDTSEPYVSKHNGMCERTNRSIEEMVRCILFDSSFSINYWCYAVDFAVYIINRLGKARLKWQSPFSQYFGNAMFHRLTHIRKFGSVGWMRRNPKKNSSRDKLSNRAIRV